MKSTDAAWLGGLLGGEGYFRYRRQKSTRNFARKYTYYYWRLQLELEMGEEEWVKRVAELCEVTYRKIPNKPYWETVIAGAKALRILKSIRPHLFGLKAQAADIIIGLGANLPGEQPRPDLPVLKRKGRSKSGPGGN